MGGELKILVLIHDQRGLDFAKGTLNYMGYPQVSGVTKPLSVFNILKQEPYEILMADYFTVSTYEENFFKELRERYNIRVILLIDSEMEASDLKRMYKEGVSAVLQYPYQIEDVKKALDDAIRSVPMAITKTVRKIRDLDFFSFLTDEELMTLLRISKCRKYAEGDLIFDEGQPGDRFYVIVDGVVSISKKIGKKREETLARLKRGSCFGEMAILDGQPRSAKAKAFDDVILLEFDKRIMGGYDDIITLKLFKKLAHVFSRRLRGATAKIKEMVLTSHAKDGLSSTPVL
ncbi:MAG: cyclic nucleotide-binding domain-containing protein [Nitrospirae bacterium]|nr:cyclic nucleotide-binding domain-containing protein [Nitrospirota bacterium]MBF0617143.1 cyclic nucleotide-binding domain-containing protein [Nitrospirota bacterium]